jgi:hypothetical protein
MDSSIPVGFSAEQLEFLNSRYVLKDACIERHEEDSQRITNILVTLTKVSSQISIMIKILSVIGGTVFTALVGTGVAAIAGVILK